MQRAVFLMKETAKTTCQKRECQEEQIITGIDVVVNKCIPGKNVESTFAFKRIVSSFITLCIDMYRHIDL